MIFFIFKNDYLLIMVCKRQIVLSTLLPVKLAVGKLDEVVETGKI